MGLFKKYKMTLWHPDSPGMRVTVYRTWIDMLFKSSDFATIEETLRSKNNERKKNNIP